LSWLPHNISVILYNNIAKILKSEILFSKGENMFALGFLIMLISAGAEIWNGRQVALHPRVRYSVSFCLISMGMLSSLMAYSVSFYYQDYVMIDFYQHVRVLGDPRYYLAVVFECVGFWLAIKNYAVNGNNLTAINFSLLFSLVFIPLLAYFANDFFGFDNTLRVTYASSVEFFVFIGIMLICVVLFFVDKLKAKINHVGYLIALPCVLSMCMFLTSKLMQTYDPFLTYAFVTSAMLCSASVMIVKYKESVHWHIIDKKRLMKMLSLVAIAIPLSGILVQLLAVEFITLVKRMAQIIVSYLMDKHYGNHSHVHTKDKYLILVIVVLGSWLYYSRH
jgi:hypothetical protein